MAVLRPILATINARRDLPGSEIDYTRVATGRAKDREIVVLSGNTNARFFVDLNAQISHAMNHCEFRRAKVHNREVSGLHEHEPFPVRLQVRLDIDATISVEKSWSEFVVSEL